MALAALVGRLYSYLYYKKDRYRIRKLIERGLRIGSNVYIMEGVEFDVNYPDLIEIGDHCRIARGVRLLSHDATTFRDLGINRLAPVRILEGSWIAERVIILPGVTIGPRALVTAGTVVNRDVQEGKAVAGNPARPYGRFEDLLEKYREMVQEYPRFRKEDVEKGKVPRHTLVSAVWESKMAFLHGVPATDPYYFNADYRKVRRDAEFAFRELLQPSVLQEKSGQGAEMAS